MSRSTIFLALLMSCRFNLPEADVSTPDVIAPLRCDVTKPFSPPVLLEGVNTSADESWGWLSADDLTLYFVRVDTGADLYVATRNQSGNPFTAAAKLEGVNTSDYEGRPTLTADGLAMFLETFGPDIDIHVSVRTTPVAIFSNHVPVAGINTASNEANPWIGGDGLAMYFASDRMGTLDIFKATRTSINNQFGQPMALDSLNTSYRDESPVLSSDELEIFFASTRMQNGPSPFSQIFHATRSTPNEDFGIPTLVVEISSPASQEGPTWLSSDSCRLLFHSNRDGNFDIWTAARSQ
jgi:hypothetical protein